MNKVKQLISHNISSKNLPLNNKWSPVRIFIQSYFCYFKSKHETFPCPYSRSTVNTGKFSQWGGMERSLFLEGLTVRFKLTVEPDKHKDQKGKRT